MPCTYLIKERKNCSLQCLCLCSRTPASFCSWTSRFESYLVANLSNRFTLEVVQILFSNESSFLDLSRCMTKPTKWHVRPASLRSVWTFTQSDQSFPCTQCVDKDQKLLHEDSQGSDQTWWMPRLIWVFAGCTGNFVGFVMWQLKLYVTRKGI